MSIIAQTRSSAACTTSSSTRNILIVDRGLFRTQREALDTEVKCYGSRGRRHELKFCYAARSYENTDRERVRASRRCIEAERRNRVEQIWMAALVDNDGYTIIHSSASHPIQPWRSWRTSWNVAR